MAKLMYLKEGENLSSLVGKFVYLAYTPSRCGVIIDARMHGSENPPIMCDVEWLKVTKTYPDKITAHRLSSLNDFTELIKEHQNKFVKHKKTLEALKKLKYRRHGIWVLKEDKKRKCFDVLYFAEFLNEPTKNDILKLQQMYPDDIVEVCPKNLVESQIRHIKNEVL